MKLIPFWITANGSDDVSHYRISLPVMHPPAECQHAQQAQRRQEGHAKKVTHYGLEYIAYLLPDCLLVRDAISPHLCQRFGRRLDRALFELINRKVDDSLRRDAMYEGGHINTIQQPDDDDAAMNCGCARRLRNTLVGSKKIPVSVPTVDMRGGGFGTAGMRIKLNATNKTPRAQKAAPVPMPPVIMPTMPRTTTMIPTTTSPIPAYNK